MRKSNENTRIIVKTSDIFARKKWYAIIPLLLFFILALSIEAGITVHFEGWAYNETVEHMSYPLTMIVKGVTHLGDTGMVTSFCLLLFFIKRSRKTIAVPVSASVILSFMTNIALKHLFARERPDILRLINETSYSFPSGHATINMALYMMLILLIFHYLRNRRVQFTLSAVCLALAISIGLSRIYLGVHYAGDVIGGWLIGYTQAILIFFVWREKKGAPQGADVVRYV